MTTILNLNYFNQSYLHQLNVSSVLFCYGKIRGIPYPLSQFLMKNITRPNIIVSSTWFKNILLSCNSLWNKITELNESFWMMTYSSLIALECKFIWVLTKRWHNLGCEAISKLNAVDKVRWLLKTFK